MKKVLLDENLPKPLKKHFSEEFEVFTVHDLGWQSKKDKELLEAIVKEDIGILITADRNLQYQQNLEKYPVQVIVIISLDNRYKSLFPKVPQIEVALKNASETEKLITVDLR